MANWKGHVVGGFVFGAAYVAALTMVPVAAFAQAAGILHGWEAIAAVFVLAMLFGLFPDVDTNSRAQDLFLGGAFVVDIILIVSGRIEAAAYLGIVALTPIVSHHRGWTHSKWAMFVVPLPILVVPYIHNHASWPVALIYYGAAFIGYFSHLFLDGLIIRQFRIKN